jgi:hypothetical protein
MVEYQTVDKTNKYSKKRKKKKKEKNNLQFRNSTISVSVV